ncbi:putative bifunctional diguanylate cyclase/phosphodiesterase [Pseudidiomarina insulisalsae]|uniref:GGDEF-domain containing protein n=1 Tax=Pseudidiomarina insulisalsae TaxID=575789 RepID=A0A432YCB6_9GAMM|nr:GGDEF domain-containing phosphodiesterase [Pseudidiomarina insulisalsae]RUO58571.1 hypothetical protein CWI71_10500 [Pseudidiomarina insulisalsae]
MQRRWQLVRNLLLITAVGVLLTIISTRFILHSEEQTIRQRLAMDTQQLEHQFRQRMLSYAFVTELTARNVERDADNALANLADEARALFLYYPSIERVLVLDENFQLQFQRFSSRAELLDATSFIDTPIAPLLSEAGDAPHALSAPAAALSNSNSDVVIAKSFATAEQRHYLLLVIDVHHLFDSVVRSEITEGYQVAIRLDEQTIYRFAGNDALRDDWSSEVPLKFASNLWYLELWPTQERLDAMYSVSAELVFFGGLALTMGGLLLGWRSHRLRDLLQQRLSQVKRAGAELQKLHATEAKLLFLSDHDALTELANRNGLEHYLNEQLPLAQEQHSKLALLTISIDSFRELNHALGHPFGDEIVKRIALRINKALPQDAYLARSGIDTFIALVQVTDPGNDPERLAVAIREAISPQLFIEQHEIYCSVSIGIALAKDANYEQEQLLHHADTALYWAKQQGFFGIATYHPDQQLALKQRRERLHELRLALEKQQIELHYQPIIHLREHRAYGVEGLLRWRTSDQRTLAPAQFLNLMEQTGLVFSVTEFIIKSACQQLRHWHKQLQRPLLMSLNFSLRQLTMPELSELIHQHLRRAQLQPEHLQIEIEESVYLQLCQSHHSTVEKLKKSGVRICVTLSGVSNCLLKAMQQCPPHCFKISPELVADMPSQAIPTELVESIIRLAQNSHSQVIAVAVEHQQQIDFLLQRDCVLAQGNYFASALPAEQLGERLTATLAGH